MIDAVSSNAHIAEVEQLESLVDRTVRCNLFDERPLGLNALFRFQLGSNIFDGYEFAREAWKRVVGDGGTVQQDQSLTGLRYQKDLVKRELKQFEVHFQKFYGRPPSRLDKECLRRLYEFHKQLKACIQAEEVKLERNNRVSGSVTGSIIAAPPKPDILSAPLSVSTSASNRPSPSRERVGIDVMDMKVLKAEKRALKIKLRRFEDDFIRQNGHKPQSYHEVGAIREDYTRYKLLKEAVQSATEGGNGSSPKEYSPFS